MDNCRAALYCHAEQQATPKATEQELQRQQELLEQYAITNGMELYASYLHVGAAYLDLSEIVLLHMLQDAKRNEFDVILIEGFELFPECEPEDIPPIRLLSVEENKIIEIGESSDPVFDKEPMTLTGAAVYFRNGSETKQWNLRFLD